MAHVTFDLETLGNQTTAPIVQIGAVVFNEKGEVLDFCNFKCNLATIPENDFSVDYDTLRWWMNQIARNTRLVDVMNGSMLDHKEMVEQFIDWNDRMIDKHGELEYWSHATFDPPILDRHCKIYKLKRLPFRQQRDIRTLTSLAGFIDVKRQGNHHDALDDCRYQAKYVAKGLSYIKEGKHGL